MSFAQLVAALYGAGISYSTTPAGTLSYRAPAGALTPALRQAMAEHKDGLLFLCSGGVTIHGRGRQQSESTERVN